MKATRRTVAALTAIAAQPWRRSPNCWRNVCRFCKREDNAPLWKYGVRHYCCDDCRDKIIKGAP